MVIVDPINPIGNLSAGRRPRILDSGVMLVIDEAFMAFTEPRHSAEQLISSPTTDNRHQRDQVGWHRGP